MEIIKRLTRNWPRLTALALGLLLVLVLIGGMELLFFWLNQRRHHGPNISLVYSRKFHQTDELLGYKPIPLTRVKVTKKIGDHIIYETSYAFDAYSRRITPVNPPLDRKKFIAFFGGSLTFGEGVKENETMAFYTGQLAPDYRPYNYGFSGYGPQQMLAKLQQEGMERELPEGKGVLVYTFFGGHISRAIGSMQVYVAWSHDMPYYTLNQHGELVRQGSFTTGRPLLSFFYKILGNSQFAKYFRVDLPSRVTQRHIRLTTKIIEESCRTFQRRFPGSDFCLVINPGARELNGEIPRLRQAGIKVLNYVDLWKGVNQAGLAIEHDGHPTALANRKLAVHLVRDLGLGHQKKQPE